MELILIRHGKAEQRGSVSPDENRQLVPKGIEKLERDLPYLLIHLKNRSEVFLWTSGIRRARETADLVSRICDIKKIYTKEFLETGEYKELLKSLKNMPEEATIIMVGHEPDLSFWSERLCRKTIVYKKGGAAIIKVDKEAEIKGKLVQALKPGEFHRLTNGKKVKKD
ncbi:histidine phosphatase family protein [Eubacteriaceae bacterium ES3]|nr:histidine phosphatase family protein [Eubacteriaceae bacterium ES3]